MGGLWSRRPVPLSLPGGWLAMDKPSTAGPLAGRTAWARNLGASARDFLRAEAGGAVVLVGAALVALVWANSPWPRSYESFWTMELTLSLGDYVLSTDLRGLVNEGFMTLFFLVVGLEAKRELDLGELRERGRMGSGHVNRHSFGPRRAHARGTARGDEAARLPAHAGGDR